MKLLERLEEQIKILRVSKKEYSKRLSDLKDKNDNLFNSIKIITEEQKELVKKYNLLNVKLVKATKKLQQKDRVIENYEEDIKIANATISKLSKKINKLKENNKKIGGAKGGLLKENNYLKESVKDLTFKLEESMTDKYVLKKLPSGKRPKGDSMRLKSQTFQSKIVKQMHREDSNE